MLKVVIIDDDPLARNFINKIISSNFKELDVVALGKDVKSGLEAINKNSPDIVFLDVDMPDGTGFNLLQQLPSINFKLIFITAHSEYAIKAIKFSALDYFLKPIDVIEFTNSLKEIIKTIKKDEQDLAISTFMDNMNNAQNKKIVLNTSENIFVVNITDIVRCFSEGNYTTFYLNNQPKIMIAKTLKEYEALLSSYNFVRIHRSHLVNINYIEKYSKENGKVYMKDNSSCPVSHRKKDDLIDFLKKL